VQWSEAGCSGVRVSALLQQEHRKGFVARMYRYPNALAPEGATSFTFAPEVTSLLSQLDIAVASCKQQRRKAPRSVARVRAAFAPR